MRNDSQFLSNLIFLLLSIVGILRFNPTNKMFLIYLSYINCPALSGHLVVSLAKCQICLEKKRCKTLLIAILEMPIQLTDTWSSICKPGKMQYLVEFFQTRCFCHFDSNKEKDYSSKGARVLMYNLARFLECMNGYVNLGKHVCMKTESPLL